MSANNFTTTGELYKTHTAEYNLSVSILIVIGGLGATLFVCLILYTCYVIVVEMFHVATEACTWLVRKGQPDDETPDLTELEEINSDEDDHAWQSTTAESCDQAR